MTAHPAVTLWPAEPDDMLAYEVTGETPAIFTHTQPTYEVRVVPTSAASGAPATDVPHLPDGYVVRWTDYVTGEWGEWFPSLPLALARTALLIEAVPDGSEDGVGRFFTTSPAEFATAAGDLFDANLD